MAQWGGSGEPMSVEFEVPDTEPAPDVDDVLETGGRRFDKPQWTGRLARPSWLSMPDLLSPVRTRWLALDRRRRRRFTIGIAAVLVIALGTAVFVGRPTASHKPTAVAPAPVVAVKPQPPYDPDIDTTTAVGPSLNTPGGDVRDIGLASDTLYVLGTSYLSVINTLDRSVLRQTPLATSVGSRLVLDIPDGTMWVLNVNSGANTATEFDMLSLKPLRSVGVPATIYDAVVLDGRLYLATLTGVDIVRPGVPKLVGITTTATPPQALAADGDSHVVIALTPGSDGRLVTIANDGALVQPGPVLGVVTPTLARMNGALWVGGVGSSGGVRRFDESTMLPMDDDVGNGRSIDRTIGAGLQVTAGAADIWAYSPSALRLYCVDTNSGAVLERWDGVTQTVATGGSGPYVVSRGLVEPLVLRGSCLG